MSYEAERAAIIEVGRRLYEKGLVTATDGNISVRVTGGHLVTTSGVSKGALTRAHVVFVGEDGQAASGSTAVSSEDMMHTGIYRLRPEVRAVIHAHPPTATAFAVAHLPLDTRILAESVLVLGPVPLIPYVTPGTAELAAAVTSGLGACQSALLANHGTVTVGQTLTQALHRMETLEHLARVTFMARQLGGVRELPPEEIEKLLVARSGPYR